MWSADIEYDEGRQMWCVTVYHDGHFDHDSWFHTEMAARYYAERARLGQVAA